MPFLNIRGDRMKFLKEWGPFFGILLLIVLIRSLIITPGRVDGSSMSKTLEEGDILLLNKLDQNYERFEIIVFDIGGEKLIKRIIGLPGETVEFKNNVLYINGEKVDENYGTGIMADFNLSDLGYSVIPDNTYFVVGDNRNNSLDSRYFGCIDQSQIIGTVHRTIFPFSKFGKVH